MSNVTPVNRKVTMSPSTLKSQKTSNGLINFHINDKEENRGRIEISTLYLVFYNFQRIDKGLNRLRKWG